MIDFPPSLLSCPPPLSESFVCDVLKCSGARIEKGGLAWVPVSLLGSPLQRSNGIEGSSENSSISFGSVLRRLVGLPEEGL